MRSTCLLLIVLAGTIHASTINYLVAFTGSGGLGIGSFTFDAGGATNTTVSSATFGDFVVPVSSVDYVAQSASDDQAIVDGSGMVTSVVADLEPGMAMQPSLQLLSTGLTYQLFDSNGNQIASGNYQIASVPEPASIVLVSSGLSLLGLTLCRRKLRARIRLPITRMQSVPRE